jgi:hypothetical protein
MGKTKGVDHGPRLFILSEMFVEDGRPRSSDMCKAISCLLFLLYSYTISDLSGCLDTNANFIFGLESGSSEENGDLWGLTRLVPNRELVEQIETIPDLGERTFPTLRKIAKGGAAREVPLSPPRSYRRERGLNELSGLR